MKLTRTGTSTLAVAALCGAVIGSSVAPAEASVTFTVMQMGDDVVVSSAGGTLDLSAWSFLVGGAGFDNVIVPSGETIFFGGQADLYETPLNYISDGAFGSGGFTFTSTASVTDVYGLASGFGIPQLVVPVGYVSNAPLAGGSMTFENADYDTLGLSPGVYTYAWGYGELPPLAPLVGEIDTPDFPPHDFIRLEIKPSGVPDVGSTSLLGLLAFGALGLFRRLIG